MKIFKLMFLILWLPTVVLPQLPDNTTANDNLLPWSQQKRLKWSDFKGNPLDTFIIKGTDFRAKAVSCIELTYSYNYNKEYIVFEIENVFNKAHSFVRENPTKQLLLHEQCHFDIAELYVRKMRKAIHELQVKKVKELGEYLNIFESLRVEMDSLDLEYDEDTFYGEIKKHQEIWANKIECELNILQEYRASDK